MRQMITESHGCSDDDDGSTSVFGEDSCNKADHVCFTEGKQQEEKHVVREDAADFTAEDRNLCQN